MKKDEYHFLLYSFPENFCAYLIVNRDRKRNIRTRHLSGSKLAWPCNFISCAVSLCSTDWID